jgi:non-heme chloroperoxidase
VALLWGRLDHSRRSGGAPISPAGSDVPESTATITGHELEQCEQANITGKPPVVFVHGLWLLPSSRDRWAALFEESGYVALAPGWPDAPETVEEAEAHPQAFAGKSVGQVADHFEEIIRGLDRKPAIVGHSFGGLLAQILAGRGLAAASVAIDPAPFRGVLPLPISSLKSAFPVLGNPANRSRAVPLTYDQFRYALANAVSEDEAEELYETFSVPLPVSRSSRRPPPTSTHGPRPRWIRGTRSAGPCWSSPASWTTPSRGRSHTRPTSSSRTTRA